MNKRKSPSLPEPIGINLKRWPALDPKSPVFTGAIKITPPTVIELIDHLQDETEACSDSWDRLGARGDGDLSEVSIDEFVTHSMNVATMRYVMKADHAMRAAFAIVEDLAAERNGAVMSMANILTVMAMLSEAIRPSIDPGVVYQNHVAQQKAAAKLKLRKAVRK